jgi:inorganic pyrophosphatase/exopolyphosphatase
VLSDTVILNSPTTTDRDRSVIGDLEQVLAVDAPAFGRDMFERTSDLSSVPADEIVQAIRGRRADASHRPGRDRRPGSGRAA